MAVIYKTTGGRGEGSTDAGTAMPLAVIDGRLRKYSCTYRGGTPPEQILPVTAFFTHVVIEVSQADGVTAKFPKPGYYQVTGLTVPKAGFLFGAQKLWLYVNERAQIYPGEAEARTSLGGLIARLEGEGYAANPHAQDADRFTLTHPEKGLLEVYLHDEGPDAE